MELTKSQINKLGDRIRNNKTLEGDAKLLDDFRNSFNESFEMVSAELKKIIKPYYKNTTLTNRQTKTSISIKEKLVRLKTRLSEMRDIRGCRIVADDSVLVYKILYKIKKSKLTILKIDFREEEVGYRAIHIIVLVQEKPIEIQLRTRLQDIWANICEKYSSKENDLKYGFKEAEVRKSFQRISEMFMNVDDKEREYHTQLKSNLVFYNPLKAYHTWKLYKGIQNIRKEIEKTIVD